MVVPGAKTISYPLLMRFLPLTASAHLVNAIFIICGFSFSSLTLSRFLHIPLLNGLKIPDTTLSYETKFLKHDMESERMLPASSNFYSPSTQVLPTQSRLFLFLSWTVPAFPLVHALQRIPLAQACSCLADSKTSEYLEKKSVQRTFWW